MTISPFTVYLVMQADEVCTAFFLASIISPVGAAALFAMYHMDSYKRTSPLYKDERDQVESYLSTLLRWAKRLSVLSAVSLPLAVLLPSTKTLAAMIIVPAIVNSDAIQKDVPEIYELAKDRLKEALK